MDSVKHFEAWVASASPGDTYVYYQGFLCHDRSYTVWVGRVQETLYNEPTHSVGLAAKAAYEAGKVHLLQRRVGPEDFEYLAIRRKK